MVSAKNNTGYKPGSYRIVDSPHEEPHRNLYQIYETKNENVNSEEYDSIDPADNRQKMRQMIEIEKIIGRNDKENSSVKLPSINSRKTSISSSQPQKQFIQRKIENKEKRIQLELQ